MTVHAVKQERPEPRRSVQSDWTNHHCYPRDCIRQLSCPYAGVEATPAREAGKAHLVVLNGPCVPPNRNAGATGVAKTDRHSGFVHNVIDDS